jgi:hypothetical protein
VTFDPCEDCGSDLQFLTALLFLGFAWLVPFILAAVRRHRGANGAHDQRLARAEWVSAIIASYLSFLWIRSPWF